VKQVRSILIKWWSEIGRGVAAGVAVGALGVLELARASGSQIPCRAAASCQAVALLPISKIAGVHLSTLGLLGVLVLFGTSFKAQRISAILALLIAVCSLVLQVTIRQQHQLSCEWCALACLGFAAFGFSGLKRTNDSFEPLPSITALVVSAALVLTYSLQVGSAGKTQQVLLGLNERSLLLDAARQNSYVIFSCISCPACRDLMVAELGRGRQEQIQFFYFDVHQDEANLGWQFEFESSVNSGDLAKARDLLRRVSYVPEGNLSIPQSWLKERFKETQLAKSLGIRETPTIFKISENEVSQLTATQFLSR
jgi:hypothetical protein